LFSEGLKIKKIKTMGRGNSWRGEVELG